MIFNFNKAPKSDEESKKVKDSSLNKAGRFIRNAGLGVVTTVAATVAMSEKAGAKTIENADRNNKSTIDVVSSYKSSIDKNNTVDFYQENNDSSIALSINDIKELPSNLEDNKKYMIIHFESFENYQQVIDYLKQKGYDMVSSDEMRRILEANKANIPPGATLVATLPYTVSKIDPKAQGIVGEKFDTGIFDKKSNKVLYGGSPEPSKGESFQYAFLVSKTKSPSSEVANK